MTRYLRSGHPQRGSKEGESPPSSFSTAPGLPKRDSKFVTGQLFHRVPDREARAAVQRSRRHRRCDSALLVACPRRCAFTCSARIRISCSCYTFAFIPARYDNIVCSARRCPAASAPKSGPSSPMRCIHADWMHLGVNAVWLLPFGSAVARRFGALRFLLFFAVTAAAGALGVSADAIGRERARWSAPRRRYPARWRRRCVLRFSAAARSDMFARRRRQRIPCAGVPLSGILRDRARPDFPRSSGSAVNMLFGLGSMPLPASPTSRSPGRRISAAFSPACCCFRWFDPVVAAVESDDSGAAQ